MQTLVQTQEKRRECDKSTWKSDNLAIGSHIRDVVSNITPCVVRLQGFGAVHEGIRPYNLSYVAPGPLPYSNFITGA